MQEELGWTRSSLRKCIRPLVENGLRAHDDDPRVPVLDNRHGCEKPCYDAGSRARRLTVFSSFLFFADFWEANFKPLRLAGTANGCVHRAIVVPAREHGPTDPGQLVRSGNDHYIAGGPAFQATHPLPQTRSFAFDAQHRSPGPVDEHLAADTDSPAY